MRCLSCPVPTGTRCDGKHCHRSGTSAGWDAHIAGRSRILASRPPTEAADWAEALACPYREDVQVIGCCNGTVARCRAGRAVDPSGAVERWECLRCVRARRPIVTP